MVRQQFICLEPAARKAAKKFATSVELEQEHISRSEILQNAVDASEGGSVVLVLPFRGGRSGNFFGAWLKLIRSENTTKDRGQTLEGFSLGELLHGLKVRVACDKHIVV
jgi:hypothetical protein